LSVQSKENLKAVTTAKDKEYRTFINPNNKDNLQKAAKERLGMSTQEELEEEVNKAKIPLQEWENTFEGKSAQEVKENQEKLERVKQELTVNLSEWKDVFPNQTAEQARREREKKCRRKKTNSL